MKWKTHEHNNQLFIKDILFFNILYNGKLIIVKNETNCKNDAKKFFHLYLQNILLNLIL